ncbi:hypothetical protein GE061_003155 [Apolygus lucorum]|uniref:G-protein coupled receptors family 1 profile domain-containing protein n=1 Tax=Apolygus lucorum TaxID=248454 RepID=A0A8S9X1C6_APOLU|nr:hypothetical protein GE061_003155 [Apolygus lucorum]
MCKLIHYAQNVSAICSVFTLTAMSVERYYAIVHPMKAKYVCTIRQARKIIISTWVSSFLLAIPILFLQVHLEVGYIKKGYWCVTNLEWPLARKMHEVYMLIIVLVIPVCVMTITYSAICREICKVAQRRYHMTSAKGNLTFESFPLSSKKTTKIKTKTTKVRLDEENVTLKQQSTSYKSEKQELGVYSVNEKIAEGREKWLQHIDRMDDSRLAKQVLLYRPRGYRDRGQRRQRWV